MSRRRKKCRCCHELFHPHPQTYRQQITCRKPACRAWRRRRAQANWRAQEPLYDEKRHGKLRAWREAHGDYWRRWRAKHPAYERRNRRLQKRRDARKRGILAKRDEWSAIWHEKTLQKARLERLAKQNEWPRFIDGIPRFLILAKQDAMAVP